MLAVKGKIYDVTSKGGFYGPGGSYENFAGREASRALAKGVTDKETAEDTRVDDLDSTEIDSLNEWASHYHSHYNCIGNVIKS